MRALILTEQTSNDRKALASVRSLAKQGFEVAVACDTRLSSAFWSRYTRQRLPCPSPISQKNLYIDWLLRSVSEHQPDVLLPVSDYTTLLVSELSAELAPLTRFAVPPVEGFHVAHDKQKLLALAEKLGIPTPLGYCPSSRTELLAIAENLSYPAVFKLRKGAGAIGLGFPHSPGELLAQYDALGDYGDDIYTAERPLVQEFVPGPIHDVCALFEHGEPRAALTQVRSLMYPPVGGVGIYNQTTEEPQARAMAIKLLRELNWHGPAMVEFKRDDRDGVFRLIEINPRLWGTLDLSIQAGFDVPARIAELAVAGSIPTAAGYQVGASYRWPFPYVLKGQLSRRDIWRLVRPQAGMHSEFRWSDPMPELAKAMDSGLRAWHRLRARGRGDLEQKVLDG